MAEASPAKICSVLATQQDDVLPSTSGELDFWAPVGAQLTLDTVRKATSTSAGSLAVMAPGTGRFAGLRSREFPAPQHVRSVILSWQVQGHDVLRHARAGLACLSATGELLTTRWSEFEHIGDQEWTQLSHRLQIPVNTARLAVLVDIDTGGQAGATWLDDLQMTIVSHEFSPATTLIRQLTASAIGGDGSLTVSLVEQDALPELRHRLLHEAAVPAGKPYLVDINQVAGAGDYLVVASGHNPVACSFSGVTIP